MKTPSTLARRQWLAQLAVAMVATSAANQNSTAGGPWIPRWNWTRGNAANCIPKHDYQHQAISPSIIVGSLPIQLVQRMSAEDRIRVAREGEAGFQAKDHLQRKRVRPARTQLRIDHCRVSDIVIDFDSRGFWYASMVAEQNFPLEPEDEVRFQQRVMLKRNQFDLKIRLLSSGVVGSSEISATDVLDREPDPGRLIIARIEPPPIWVQSERPRHLQYSGYCDQLKQDFDLIQSAEFQFSYRLDPLSDTGQTVRRLENP